MFKRIPGPVGHMSERLGLWEFQAETEATEMLQHRRDRKTDSVQPEQERLLPNFARQMLWGRK